VVGEHLGNTGHRSKKTKGNRNLGVCAQRGGLEKGKKTVRNHVWKSDKKRGTGRGR